MAAPTYKLRNKDRFAPPLKWAGGKRWLVPTMAQLWGPHAHRRLVEPFVGGMAVALGLKPALAVLNDANPHLINFYKWLQRGLVADLEMLNSKEYFYRQRETFNALIRAGDWETKQAAELFYYLNRTCFNGLCRFNSKGEYNVPFGKYKKITYTTDFSPYREALQPWSFTTGSFTDITLRQDDFIYADPPYDVEFTSYSAGGFSWEDQVRLAGWLSAHSGPVVASNQATPRILDLYSSYGFHIETRPAPRMISCDGNRTPALEMIATKGLESAYEHEQER